MKFSHAVIILFALWISVGCRKNKDVPDTPIEPKEFGIGKFLDNWTCTVNPGKTSNFDIAHFTVWVPNPADVSNLKAIVVLANHSNSNGLGLVYDKAWQDFAKANNVGLLAFRLENLNSKLDMDEMYPEAQKGSGDALLLALEAIANKNNIASIAALPFLFRGYSAGGMFGYNFSAYKPDRVIAFSNIRGWYLNPTSTVNNGIPGLFLIAELDTEQVVDNINPVVRMKEIVQAKRKQGALWSYAIEAHMDHGDDISKSDELTRLFFSTAMKYRLTNGSNNLVSVPESSGWLGDNTSVLVYSYGNYPTDKSDASWLIDEPFAKKWVSYQDK